MKRLHAFKYALRPSDRQEQQMRRFAGTCRAVFNEALQLQEARYAQGEKKLSYVEMANLLAEARLAALPQ